MDRVRVSTTDPRGPDSATKLYNLFAICLKKGRPQRDAAAQRIQDVNWQLLGRLGREIVWNLARVAYLARASTWVKAATAMSILKYQIDCEE